LEVALARKRITQNGKDRLDEAMALLIQNQATLVQTQSAFVHTQATFAAQMAQTNRENAERFERIERDIATILQVLAEHGRILQRLPEAVRDKIGFKPPESATP
jgi:hypothetical protein